MKATSMHIHLKGLQLYAYHGVLPQERQTGSYFYINLSIKTDFSQASQTDNLEGTISYADIFEAVKSEMNTPSSLLEHVCERISKRLFNDFPTIEEINIELNKENPPMGACVKSVGISAHYLK
jgi:dihydroneopterin aldolase